MASPVTTNGFEDIAELLKTLEGKRVTPALRKSLRAGAKLVLARAKDLVPYDEGVLEDTLNVRVAKVDFQGNKLGRGDIGFAVIHIEKGARDEIMQGAEGDPFYSRWVEYRTKFHDADPYIRPALYDSAGNVLALVKRTLKREIEAKPWPLTKSIP